MQLSCGCPGRDARDFQGSGGTGRRTGCAARSLRTANVYYLFLPSRLEFTLTPAEILAKRIADLRAEAELTAALTTVALALGKANGVIIRPTAGGNAKDREVVFVFDGPTRATAEAEEFFSAVKKLQSQTAATA